MGSPLHPGIGRIRLCACGASNRASNLCSRFEGQQPRYRPKARSKRVASDSLEQILPGFNLGSSFCAWPTERERPFEQFHCAVRVLTSEAEPFHPFDPRPQRGDSFPSLLSSEAQTLSLVDSKINTRLDYTKRYVYT